MTKNYKIKSSKLFKKSLKRVLKQWKDLDKLLEVVDMLSKSQKLDLKYKDHALYNDKKFNDCRDCHIEPDWVLIYKYLKDDIVLLLVDTGSQSEVLNK